MTQPQDPYTHPGTQPGQPGPTTRPVWSDSPPDPAYGGATGPRRNGLGVAALVLGVLAVLTCWTVIGGIVLGLIAIVLGVLGRGRARRREADNGGMALAGLVLGVVGLALSAALVAFGLSLLNSPEGQQYQDCLQSAGTDQVAVEQCARQFGRSL